MGSRQCVKGDSNQGHGAEPMAIPSVTQFPSFPIQTLSGDGWPVWLWVALRGVLGDRDAGTEQCHHILGAVSPLPPSPSLCV